MRKRHLLLATVENPYDLRSWSGIPFALRVALEKRVDKLTVFRPSRPRRTVKDVMLRLLLGGRPLRWPLWATEATLRRNARELRTAIEQSGADAVLSISGHCVARLDPFPVPTFLFSDAPWLSFHETYGKFDRLPWRGNKFAGLEAAAARRCDGLFFGSRWALTEADRLYFGGHASPEQWTRFHQTPLGATWKPELAPDLLQQAVRKRSRDRLDLLFVGRDWDRKGGPLAVQITEALRSRGVAACLHVVGCRPELKAQLQLGDDPAVRVHGPLYRDHADEKQKLEQLFLRSHLLLLPTEAECFGIAFAEAQAFGLPPVSRAVQALPSVVLDGETGLLLDPLAGPGKYAQRIQELMNDRDRYEEMAERGIDRARNVLHWDATAERIASVIYAA